METITHVSGEVFRVEGGRVIQRCGLCGARLVDNLNESAPLNRDGAVPETPTWPPGRLVQETVGANPKRYSLLPEVGKLPKDSCIDLVEP